MRKEGRKGEEAEANLGKYAITITGVIEERDSWKFIRESSKMGISVAGAPDMVVVRAVEEEEGRGASAFASFASRCTPHLSTVTMPES